MSMSLRLAIHEQALPSADLPERLLHATRSGWQDVSLMRRSIWQYGPERLHAFLQEHRLGVSSLGWAGGFTGSAGFTYREAIEDGRVAIEEAAQIGARTLVIAPGSRQGHTFRHAQRVICDGLRVLADLAARKRVQLALLTTTDRDWQNRWTSVNTLEMAQQILAAVPHPGVGLAVSLERWSEHPSACLQLKQLISRLTLVTSNMWSQDHAQRSEDRSPATSLLDELLAAGFRGTWELQPATTAVAAATPLSSEETFVHGPQIYFNAADRHRQGGGSVIRW